MEQLGSKRFSSTSEFLSARKLFERDGRCFSITRNRKVGATESFKHTHVWLKCRERTCSAKYEMTVKDEKLIASSYNMIHNHELSMSHGCIIVAIFENEFKETFEQQEFCSLQEFETRLSNFEEVRKCHILTGDVVENRKYVCEKVIHQIARG